MAKQGTNNGGAPRAAVGDLDVLFSGLGSVLKAAAELVNKSDSITELSRIGIHGKPSTMEGIFGVSVRVGPVRRPAFRKPASLRREPASPINDEFQEPSADLFDEGDYYVIVADLPGAHESTLKWNVKGDVLTIEAIGEDKHYFKEIQLPSAVAQQNASAAYKNGVLELRLWKQ